MKRILKLTSGLSLAICLSSCFATHQGYMANSAALSSKNFSYVKTDARGTSTVKYILGVGGIKRETLVDDAKKQMMSNSPLKDNQTYANTTLNFKNSSFLGFIYGKVKCTVTADVVEFK